MLKLADVPASFPADQVALIHDGERWTFGDLDQRSRAWAAWLAQRGVQPDDLVAFGRANGPEFFALAFGIYRAGATPAPLSPSLPPAEMAEILSVMRPRLTIGANDHPEAYNGFVSDHLAASWKACTSGGSTGTPKVIVDARPAAFEAGTEFIDIPAGSTALVPGPLYHNAPFSAGVFALWRGNTVVTMPRFDANEALALIARHAVKWALMVPTMMVRIISLPRSRLEAHDLSSWRTVVHTAAPMAPIIKRKWIAWRGAEHVSEVYGATEGLVRCWISGPEWVERPGSVGRPIAGGRIRILDAEGRDLPEGEVGEVFAMPPGGPGSTYRYIGATPRATADGWESVGDCGRLDAEGYLYLADRRDDMIISGGVNIWPAEVEAALLGHPAIRSCAVFAQVDADLGERTHALIETSEPLDIAELHAFLDGRLAKPKWPRSISSQVEAVRDDAGKFRKPRKVRA